MFTTQGAGDRSSHVAAATCWFMPFREAVVIGHVPRDAVLHALCCIVVPEGFALFLELSPAKRRLVGGAHGVGKVCWSGQIVLYTT